MTRRREGRPKDMSKPKHSVKYTDSHNKSLLSHTIRSEYSSSKSYFNFNDKKTDYDVGKKFILDKFLSSVIIYENLCSNCASPLRDKFLVYEHLCNDCIGFYSKSLDGEISLEKNKSILSGLIGSLKRIANGTPPSNKKIEIIHNVDSVFKTNSTFDFGEICKLKKKSERSESMKCSNENRTSSNKTNTSINSNRDKEFQASHIVDWMTSLRTHICYYQLNDTDNILNVKSIPSKNSFHFSCCSFPSDVIQASLNSVSTSVSNFSYVISNKSDHLLELSSDVINEEYKNKIKTFKSNLMDSQTSPEHHQAHIKNVKLRSKKRQHNNIEHSVDTVGESSSSTHIYNESYSSQSTLDSDYSRQLSLCKSSNRNGFYGKHSNNSEFVNSILTVFDSFLNRDSQTHTSDCFIPLPSLTFEITPTNTETSNGCNNGELSDSDKNKWEKSILEWNSCSELDLASIKDKFIKINEYDINELLRNLVLDISLNKIVIYYDKHLKIFLNDISLKKRNINVCQLVNLYLKWMHYSGKVRRTPKQQTIKMTVPKISSLTSLDSGETILLYLQYNFLFLYFELHISIDFHG